MRMCIYCRKSYWLIWTKINKTMRVLPAETRYRTFSIAYGTVVEKQTVRFLRFLALANLRYIAQMSLILLLIITIRIVPYTCLRCKSVCPSVCHKSTFYQNGYADHHATITTCYQRDSTRVAGTAGSYTTLRSS